MMKKILTLLAGLLLSFSVLAQEAPDALVKRVTEDVLKIVREDKTLQGADKSKLIALVDAKVLPNFDFQRMTALALGKEWRKATPQQKMRLSEEFRNLLVRTYANSFDGYRGQRIRYLPFTMSAGETDVYVRTEVLQPGAKPVQIDYNLELQSGGWKVYDVIIAGISLVTNYRDQFTREVRANGIDGLIASLATKNDTLEASAKAGK
ncbi:MAG: ABC transporter substrate-binding protein [Dechloromonas sp.]|nr:ABC transporter substrate-binding protein [Dechloromonas sp.]